MMRNQVILQDAATNQWLLFQHPFQVIVAWQRNEVLPALREVERLVNERGWFAAGFLSYEAGAAFDAAMHAHPTADFPLLWFGLFPEPTRSASPPLSARGGDYRLGAWQPTVTWEEYDSAIAQIKAHIAAGDTYQVNHTFRLRAPFAGEALALFHALVRAQPTRYAAYVDTGPFALCSASPELFFRLEGEQVSARPMKGTAARGRFPQEDEAQRQWLHSSAKNRAENVMIVDMLRNDLGRIARLGTVRVPDLFTVERYPTVWQMVSTVQADSSASVSEIFAALFPCASITGAPKVSTMHLIADLESTPRRAYTGSIGFIAPGRHAQFNVAIRTVLVDRARAEAEYGVGGGIVWDSVSEEEFEECNMKARLLAAPRPPSRCWKRCVGSPTRATFCSTTTCAASGAPQLF